MQSKSVMLSTTETQSGSGLNQWHTPGLVHLQATQTYLQQQDLTRTRGTQDTEAGHFRTRRFIVHNHWSRSWTGQNNGCEIPKTLLSIARLRESVAIKIIKQKYSPL